MAKDKKIARHAEYVYWKAFHPVYAMERWYFALESANYKTVAMSTETDGYSSESACKRAIEAQIRAVLQADKISFRKITKFERDSKGNKRSNG